MSTKTSDERDFDPDVLREKYRIERDKRLRTDGNAQYVQAADDLASFDEDPHTPRTERLPLQDDVDVVVIGGGFGGLLAGARLREAGIQSIRMVDRAGDFGGTWYWNRYPGAQCDIESYIYFPLLEELGNMPTERYAHQPEILAHSHAIARRFDLYRDVCFHTVVTELRWDDEAARWTILTDRGDAMRARFVVMANGILDRVKLPRLPGAGTFQGHAFHTSRWDYDYTGGDASGNLTALLDKRVGVIGTGATAVQCVPHLGAWSKELFVFQRTPSSIDLRNNRPTDPEWTASLEPGWQKRRMENFSLVVSGGFAEEDLVNDGWTDIVQRFLVLFQKHDGDLSLDQIEATMEIADFQKMNALRDRVDSIVWDRATAEALKPWYRLFCKRPCFHDEYLSTFNRPNVTLVDTNGRGVEQVTSKGVVVDGREYELDCLIFATGFEYMTEFTRRAGFDLIGRDGLALSEKWRDGMSSLHGMLTREFPNAFLFSPAQGGFAFNFTHALSELSQHAAYIIRHAIDHDIQTVEPTPEGEAEWVHTIVDRARVGEKFFAECTPGYYNAEGTPGGHNPRNSFFGGGAPAFFQLLAAWREDGQLRGLELTPAETPAASNAGEATSR